MTNKIESHIPFNLPYSSGEELELLFQCISNKKLSGDGPFTKQCHQYLKNALQCQQALLTHSCTAALEMSALLIDIKNGDEVIMPSYTFVSTANAFVLRGARPIFIDINPDTLNINEQLIAEAITHKTKAIVPVHYAGVACEMLAINQLAKTNHLYVIEDAAQAVGSFYHKKPLGTFGDLAAFSFHETKNIISGEGGALIINNPIFSQRAEIIREKGTNRSQFLRGEIDKYTWHDIGSSYLPSELIAAFLLPQLQNSYAYTNIRKKLWNYYYQLFENLEKLGKLKRPKIPQNAEHNAHIFYLILSDDISREKVLTDLREKGIQATAHYEPLHSSPAGLRYGRTSGNMNYTNKISKQIIRLPLWIGLTATQQEYIAEQFDEILNAVYGIQI
jgi:dTDP-4-amino-4,6-dideoxygalactose transaminase